MRRTKDNFLWRAAVLHRQVPGGCRLDARSPSSLPAKDADQKCLLQSPKQPLGGSTAPAENQELLAPPSRARPCARLGAQMNQVWCSTHETRTLIK